MISPRVGWIIVVLVLVVALAAGRASGTFGIFRFDRERGDVPGPMYDASGRCIPGCVHYVDRPGWEFRGLIFRTTLKEPASRWLFVPGNQPCD